LADRPLRLVLVTQNFPPDLGGIQNSMGNLSRRIVEAGHRLTILADRNKSGDAEPELGAAALRRFTGPRPWRRLRKRLALASMIRAGAIDGIIADSYKSIEAIPATTLPILVFVHGTELPPKPSHRKNLRIRRALARSHAIIANSRFTAGITETYADPRHIFVVNPPIPPAIEPTAEEVAEAARIAGDRGPVVFTISRLEPRKGVDMVIRGLAALRAEHPGLLYVVAGGGPDRERLEALVAEAGMAGHVTFPGRITEGLKTALLRRSDLFAMPTRREGHSVEGFGLVYVEAAQQGVTSLADGESGAADAVLDGRTGLLCRGDDQAAVTAALRRLLGDPDLRRRLGEAARQRAETELVWAHVLPEYLRLLMQRG
jgi:phosphatidylinositol alpha-1,6-mannosyltransferase